ncbi:extracellular solute-binding protein [Mesorhizobium sp. M0140]|uniref:ABC transporter substrate-binding protein n=1 Tax=Mesorhizobium sp. M0140 TaxID=2956893 RepID=UPI00333A1B59
MKRRAFLKFATMASASALAAPYVHAQSKKFSGITLRMNGFGGLWDETIIKTVVGPLEERTGMKIQFTPGSQSTELVKLIASRENPPYDIFQADSAYMVELLKNDLIEEFSERDIPSVKRILPGFQEYGNFGIPFAVSSVVPVYNSESVKQPLTSYSDIARPDLVGQVVLPAPTFDTTSLYLLGIAEENGGSISNMEPAYNVLADAKPNIVALAQATVAQLQMFQNQEASAGIFWDGRAYELRSKGVPMVTVVPPQGIYSINNYVTIVKGTKHPEAIHEFAEQFLSDKSMLGLPAAFRYAATTDVKLPDEYRQDLLYNSPERLSLRKNIDWNKWIADRNERIERVNKVLRS